MSYFKLFCLLLFVSACSTSPTGRKQFISISDSKINRMGAMSFEQLKKEKARSYDRRTIQYVNCVINRLIPHVQTNIKNWEVVVFKDPTANAFALPGGYIGVHTGLLKVAVNEDQLAAVLGHEIGHVTARHGAEKVSSAMAAQLGLSILQIATEEKANSQYYILGAGLLTQYTILMPHGRTQESESDEIGLFLMAKAGFDPRESVSLWENMKKNNGSGPPEFLSTHPSSDNRIKNLTRLMPQAMSFYSKSNSRKCGN